jgi:serine/threonine protein phosphatase PrpC
LFRYMYVVRCGGNGLEDSMQRIPEGILNIIYGTEGLMKSFSITDIGLKRTVNQDCVYCNEEAVGAFPNLFIVADGMGGHKAGDMASRLCVDTVIESVKESVLRTPVSIMNEAVFCAHNRIQDEAVNNPDYRGMGTTLVMATVMDGAVNVANIGDSRLYILSDSLNQITEDHSLVEEMVKSGELAKENVRSHPNKNIITRALGIGYDTQPDYFNLDINEGDIILMCSDGLTNMLEDAEIEYIIKNNRDDLKKAGMTLLNRANEAGGRDNITVLLVEV